MGTRRTICFVTGTRAEFGLMVPVLRAIREEARLRLQIVATGMHLDPRHGRTVEQVRGQGWRVDETIPWKPAGADRAELARQTGLATAGLARAYARLAPDVVLVVGDRVEAFAAATAAHLAGIAVAHVHGGDRALGQVDDALRHAITKLAHVHFPATRSSAERILKLGEDRWRVHTVGSPGIDGIVQEAWDLNRCRAHLAPEDRQVLSAGGCFDPTAIARRRYALLLLHPTQSDDGAEFERAGLLLHTTLAVPFDHAVVVYPNNDPGSAGIVRRWERECHVRRRAAPAALARPIFVRNLPRGAFLGLMRDAAVLVGNSSSGIIEAASFGTPVIDVGDRQQGRERGGNVTTVPFRRRAIDAALRRAWNGNDPVRFPRKNPYGRGDTGRRIARVLAEIELDERMMRKLIAY